MGLRKALSPVNATPIGTVVIGVVDGYIHDIGKNLVKIMIDTTGNLIVDLGRDVPVKGKAMKEQVVKADVLTISALMATAMPKVKKALDELAALGMKGRIKALIGGAPASMESARSIGADSWGKDATLAVHEAGRLIAELREAGDQERVFYKPICCIQLINADRLACLQSMRPTEWKPLWRGQPRNLTGSAFPSFVKPSPFFHKPRWKFL